MINNEMKNKSFWQAAITLPKSIALEMEVFMVKSGALGFHELLFEDGVTDNLQNDNTIHYYYFASDFPVTAFIPMALGFFNCENSPFEIKQVHYEDFLKNMEETFSSFKLSNSFTVVPPWKKDEVVPGEKLIINPAFAFGTGRHATTRLMVEVMETINFKGKTVMDMGTGSGILCIASLLLGASHVTGIDVESLSVESANENYQLNRDYHKLKNVAQFIEGDFSWIESNPEFQCNVFLSNILPDIFYNNGKNFLRFLQKADAWILSGIVREKKDNFLKWLTALTGVDNIREQEKEDWFVFYHC